MGDIDVAAHNELTPLLQGHEVRVNHFKETVLCLLTLRPRRATGEIHAQQRQLALGCVKAQFDIAALGVKFAAVKALDHMAGLVAGVDAHTRVAFFFGALEVTVQASQLLEAADKIAFLGFDLLHTHTIRLGFFKPALQPFAAGRADAVEVKAGECEQGIPYG